MLKKSFNGLFTAYFLCIIFFFYFFYSIFALTGYFVFWPKRHYAYAVFAKIWATTTLLLTGFYPERKNGHFPKERKPFIFVMNHQSQLDILIALAILPVGIRFIAKEELFRKPLLGFAMRRCGYIPIKREASRKASEALDKVKALVHQGVSILVFPEGTRSLNGDLGKIKRGSLMIAFETETPLLPVALDPAYRIMPKGRMLLSPAHLRMAIGAPLIFDWGNPTRDVTKSATSSVQEELQLLLNSLR